jgi:maltose alpha-D-glucosyltransferase/alpha-amylase
MQWNDGLNAGFSTASPDQLYCAVLDHAPYSYRVRNVEAQRADPDSLLNRTRDMIRVRKSQLALCRGDVEFLDLGNRAVLTYLRSYHGNTVLIVNNLSAGAQSIELDLARFAGQQPTDLLSASRLHKIEQEPYRLYLEGYEYRWLCL